MNAFLTDEQVSLGKTIDDFCAREVGSREALEKLTEGGTREHSPELYRKMADLGWLGLITPEAYGGSATPENPGIRDMVVFLDHTMQGVAPIAGVATTLIAAAAYDKFAAEDLKKEVLEGVVAGDVLSISMSEPGAGSDVAALQCKAEKVGDEWVINGQKTWCSNAHFATSIMLVARTDRSGSKHEGISMFHVPADTPGLQITGIDTMGGREVNDLYFTDVRLPADALIGTEGGGWMQLITGLNIERLILAAQQLGLAQRAFDMCLKFLREREQFGRPIGTFQALRHRMADLATEIEATRLLVYSVAAKVDANPGELFPREASMAKLKATELSKRVTLDCMQSMGGYGYATEYGMEHLVRLALVSSIYGGTNEIQRDIIGKTYGL